uniref:Uncharacterized protein n=1 Tax=Arundo donax TaxID=35708 RepID=A0A0A9EQD8_ARUDO
MVRPARGCSSPASIPDSIVPSPRFCSPASSSAPSEPSASTPSLGWLRCSPSLLPGRLTTAPPPICRSPLRFASTLPQSGHPLQLRYAPTPLAHPCPPSCPPLRGAFIFRAGQLAPTLPKGSLKVP